MKDNRGDRIVDNTETRIRRVKDKLAKDYKGVKPFRMEQVPPEVLDWIYDHMNEEDLGYAAQTYGEDDVNQFIDEMEKRRQKNA